MQGLIKNIEITTGNDGLGGLAESEYCSAVEELLAQESPYPTTFEMRDSNDGVKFHFDTTRRPDVEDSLFLQQVEEDLGRLLERAFEIACDRA